MFPIQAIDEVNNLIELQDMIFGLNSKNIIKLKSLLSKDDQFLFSHVRQIALYIYFATIIRPYSDDLLLDLILYLISIGNDENHYLEIPNEYSNFVFEPPPSKSEITFKNGPISFLRKLYENSVITIDEIFERIERFNERYPKLGNSYLLFIFWFIPEVEKQRPKLYEKTLIIFDTDHLLMFPYYIKQFFQNIEKIRENDWKLFHFLTSEHYYPSSLEFAIANDDVNSLQAKILNSQINFDINEFRIECTIFETNYILQNQPTILQFSIAHNSNKCTKFLLLNGARIEEHQYSRYPTSHFAVAAQNTEILHKLEQENCSFNGTLNIATIFHRKNIFEWLRKTQFQNVTDIDFDCGPLLHSCVLTENYRVVISLLHKPNSQKERKVDINQRERTKKTILFESARTNHVDLVALLLLHSNIDVNIYSVHFLILESIFSSSSSLLYFANVVRKSPL